MNKLTLILSIIFASIIFQTNAQTQLTEAIDFHVKTIEGEPIYLFPLLDDDNFIVVIDFFSTSCGPCQQYAADIQASYEYFGENTNNVFFLGINWGNDNMGVHEFDSIYGINLPTVSGSQGGGNIVFNDYEILSYPTVIVITPDHSIVEQYIWYPNQENIINAVIAAGGIPVGNDEITDTKADIKIFPNPVNNELNIILDEEMTDLRSIDIYHITGKKTLSISSNEITKNLRINTEALQSGQYLLTINSKDGIIERRKFIISH